MKPTDINPELPELPPMPKPLPPTPECDKMTKAGEAGSQQMGNFLDWLREDKQLVLCQYGSEPRDRKFWAEPDDLRPQVMTWRVISDTILGGKVVTFGLTKEEAEQEADRLEGERDPALEVLLPVTTPTLDLLAEYFEIDLVKVEQERQAVLAYLREQHEASAQREAGGEQEKK